jgi:hypothetical protein
MWQGNISAESEYKTSASSIIKEKILQHACAVTGVERVYTEKK